MVMVSASLLSISVDIIHHSSTKICCSLCYIRLLKHLNTKTGKGTKYIILFLYTNSINQSVSSICFFFLLHFGPLFNHSSHLSRRWNLCTYYDDVCWTLIRYHRFDQRHQWIELPCPDWRIFRQFHQTDQFLVLVCNLCDFRKYGRNLQAPLLIRIYRRSWISHTWLLPFFPWVLLRTWTYSLCPTACKSCLGSQLPKCVHQGAKRKQMSNPSALSSSLSPVVPMEYRQHL